jgi:putative selenate reductase molybdopterin-binding subunit
MNIQFKLNGEDVELDVAVNESLLAVLRANGVFGVKHGCESGECGMCTVLVDGVPMNSCVMLAAQANGRSITTIEGVGGEQMRGWKGSEPLHALQTAFVETGAIQCGYCTPAMILATVALYAKTPNPTIPQAQEAISGNLCWCGDQARIIGSITKKAIRAKRGVA